MKQFLRCRKVLLLGGTLLFSASVFSQNIIFTLKDGNTNSYALNETRKIFFNGDVLVLQKKDGSTFNKNLSTLRNFRYDASTPVREFTVSASSVKIFPNPFRNVVTIRYDLRSADKVQIDMLDLQGRKIRSWPLTQQKAGMHELKWQAGDANGRAVPTGTYVCRIQTNSGVISKMLILE